MNRRLKEKLKKIKLLAMDFDGVMTDGTVYIDQDGIETVRCSRKDGLGIEMLKRAGILACVISKETNPVVTARCDKLKIKCWQKVENGESKAEILERIMAEQGLTKEEVAYMGDDLNDMAPLQAAGIAFTVADGHPLVKKISDYITRAKGGGHAVREICELILEARGTDLKF